MRRFAISLAFVGIGISALAPVTSASASPGGVEVSPDGITYSATYSGALFTGVAHLVPGDSEQATFYVRNAATEPGFLRITLRDVVASDSDFANALTLGASTFGHPATPVTVLAANPCWVLLEGQIVVPGEVVRVTTSLALGDLLGLAGQGATATAALNVALSGTTAQLPPTDCGQTGTVLPVIPEPPTSGSTSPAVPRSAGSPSAGAFAPLSSESSPASPDTDLPVLNLPKFFGIDPNTWHLFEEYLILIPIGSSILGGLIFGIAARRRKNGDELVSSV